MQMRRWNTKRFCVCLFTILICYVIFSSKYNDYEIDAVISNATPEAVWEYVADFSKMRILNPTIINFHILSESGNIHDWHYTVQYTERLSHWPYWLNIATAEYTITKSMPNIQPIKLAVQSRHETCFFKGIYCLKAISDFQFLPHSSGTYCLERIRYQCPPFLNSACRRELEFQRKAIMHNLTMIFQKL